MATLFTAEQARIGAIKSAEARRARAKELIELRARVKQFESALPAKPIVEPNDVYSQARLNRVRKQIEALSDMLDDETDPNKLDRLANAISRMSELERQLANRPLPGSLKPSSTKPTSRRPSFVEPTLSPNCGPETTPNTTSPEPNA